MFNSDQELIILSKRWKHHTKSGGYDRLAEEFRQGSTMIHTDESLQLSSLFKQSIFPRLLPSSRYVNHYSFWDLISEMHVFKHARNTKRGIVHSLYAEDQLNFLLRFKNQLHSSLIGSFHLPFESQYVQKALSNGHYKHLKNLDAAIVVSSSMVNNFEKWVGKDKVFFVPHGIDTDIFIPDDSKRSGSNEFNILSVGIHGRDWDTIQHVIKNVEPDKKSINFNAVLNEYHKQKVAGIDGVKIHSNIPEKRLIELYQEADILLLPLKFGTANNSILESIACGTPVISTNVGGIPDYVDEKSGWLFEPGDVAGITSLINSMLNNPELYLSKRETTRKQALTFDWEKISRMVRNVYEEVLKCKNGKNGF